MNFGIIGCGKIGYKRAFAIKKIGKIIACSDIDHSKSKKLAKIAKCHSYSSWKDLCNNKKIETIVVCTPHKFFDEIILYCAKRKKNIFVEKPGGINFYKTKQTLKNIKNQIKIKVGYNHRYHPSIILAKKLIETNKIGKLMYLRARYGHGGRINYQNEWRFNKSISGGGELIDQGTHLIDLTIFFFGDIKKVIGINKSFFWKRSVEDNVFINIKTKNNCIAFLHASCTEWKNLFSLEIYGRTGKIDINGLGGSYGKEKLILYKMKKKMGPPKIINYKFPKKDNSWEDELVEFIKEIRLNQQPKNNLKESLKILKIVDDIYKNNYL